MHTSKTLAEVIYKITGRNPCANAMFATFHPNHQIGKDGEVTIGDFTFRTVGFNRTFEYKHVSWPEFKLVPKEFFNETAPQA